MKASTFKPVSVALRQPSKAVSAKRGFYDQSFLNHWPDFVGAELASLCKPKGLKSTRQGYTLTLSCISAYASELAMRLDEIKIKLNVQLGGNVINKIQLHQEHIDFQTPPVKKAKTKNEDVSIPEPLSKRVQQTQNEEFRHALEALCESYYRHPKGE